MKAFFQVVVILSFFPLFAVSQQPSSPRNIFIITTDGFRWQEVFSGADTVIMKDPKYVKDVSLMEELYGDSTPALRRQKLMPFFWNVIAKKGQLFGNRNFDNHVNVSNFYKISYPGYNEILTGYADPKLVPNSPSNNPNINILEYLNQQDEYQGKVAAFSSWNIFPYILNEQRSELPVNSGYESIEENEDSTSVYINQVQNAVNRKTHCRYDQLTFLSAREYIQKHHPRVLYLGLGETDEFAHQGKYDQYLQQATNVDKMIAELWYYIQTDPFYKNNTTLIITTDHGRGKKPTSWYAHNLFVRGSGDVWQAMIGPGIEPLGEIKIPQQVYQKQIAATIANLLGKKFVSNHKVAAGISLQTKDAITYKKTEARPEPKVSVDK